MRKLWKAAAVFVGAVLASAGAANLGLGGDRGVGPDLANTQYFVDALLAAGVPRDDPAVRRALRFISRCQNLPGETNDQPFAAKATEDDKGGLTYVPLDPDDNPHKTSDGG